MRRCCLSPLIAIALLSGPLLHAQRIGDDQAYRETVLSVQTKIRAGDLAAAQEQLESAQRRYPTDGGLENLQGVLALQQHDPVLARHAFEKAIGHTPTLLAPYLNLARLDREPSVSGQPSRRPEALQLYKHVLAIDPANTEANMEIAALLLGVNEPHAALDHLSRLSAEVQQDPRAQAIHCGAEAALGDRAQTDVVASHLVLDPNLAEADVDAALPGLLMGHRADILSSLLDALAAHTSLSFHGLRLLGLAREAQGDLPGARAALEQAFTLDDHSSATLVDLARIAAAQGKDQEALGYLAHARELAPRDAALAFQFGVICFRMNLLGEARKALSEALALRPEDPSYVLAVAKVTLLSEDPLQAAPYLEHYRRLMPTDSTGKLLTGAMFFRAKDFDHATPWLTEASSAPATMASAKLYLGSIARQTSQPDQAITLLTAAAKAQPEDAQTHAELGQTYLQLKRYGEAETELDRAIALDPMSYTGNFGLVQLYAHNNDPRRAEQARRFDEVKAKHDQDTQQATRVIEMRPDAGSVTNP